MAMSAMRYAASGRNRVEGWFSALDASVFGALLAAQSAGRIRGGALEIGVHHGQSFIAICLNLAEEERALAVDIFGQQELNKDQSGKGNRTVFERNLKRFGIRNAEILAASSEKVAAKDVIARIGVPRFVSVDGGHWLEIVMNDLRLAESLLPEGGILALDDFANPDWPDVGAAFHRWLAGNPPLTPFAVTQAKIYLARDTATRYASALREHPATAAYFKKSAELCGNPVDSYGPLHGIRNRLRQIARAKYPRALAVVQRIV